MVGKSINQKIERVIGGRSMRKSHRLELLSQQLDLTVQIIPWMTLSSMIACAILLALNIGTAAFLPMFIWSVVLGLLQIPGLHAAYLRHRLKRRINARQHHFSRTCAYSGALGGVWGMLPIVAFTISHSSNQSSVLVALTMVLCGAGFCLAAIPQAVIAFSIPVVAGALFGFLSIGLTYEKLAIIAIFATIALSIPVVSMRHAKNLAKNISAKIASRENEKIVGLLLNEYEEHSGDWVWELDHKGAIHHASKQFLDAAGFNEIESPIFSEYLCSISNNSPASHQVREKIARNEEFREVELSVVIAGEHRHWRLSGKPNLDDRGDVQGFIGIGQDVTSQHESHEEIQHLALNDALTGLVNRAEFNNILDRAVTRLERDGSAFTLMFLDLDKFKAVNDTRGHLVGDALLRQVAERLTSLTRKTDTVARLGGDEFAVLMFDTCDEGVAAKLANQIIQEISNPYEIEGESHRIGLSIGIALAPQNGTQATQILRNADLALYRSKEEGRGIFRFFELKMDSDQRERRMLEAELRKALEEEEFELFFQPIMDADAKRVKTFEALIRWNHPIRGTISPNEFIPLAEQSTLIQQIDAWTMRKATLAATNWPSDISVSVNLSAQHFVGLDILEYAKAALDGSGLAPSRLEIEVTESLLIHNTDEVYRILNKLKELGISIALDDFGTGYSSLSYLLKFNFDKIKIDQAFVASCGEDRSAQAILEMISSLGKSLNMTITAEGVETEAQRDYLKSIHCHGLQGYLFAEPMQQADIAPFLLKCTMQDTNQCKNEIASQNVA